MPHHFPKFHIFLCLHKLKRVWHWQIRAGAKRVATGNSGVLIGVHIRTELLAYVSYVCTVYMFLMQLGKQVDNKSQASEQNSPTNPGTGCKTTGCLKIHQNFQAILQESNWKNELETGRKSSWCWCGKEKAVNWGSVLAEWKFPVPILPHT